MRIYLIAVGQKMPDWAQMATDDYLKRFPPGCPVVLKSVPAASRRGNADIGRIKEQEAEAILAAVPKGARVILCDERGRDRSTRALAAEMSDWLNDGQDVAIVIGGPDGLSECLNSIAASKWRLSALTLPHPLVRVLVAEQLYRAWSLLNNHPYHRE